MVGGEQVAHGRHRRKRDAALLGGVIDFHHSLLARPFLQEDLERIPVGAAAQTVGEEFQFRPLGAADHAHELLPLVFLDAANEDPPVLAFEEVERLDRLAAEA